MKCISFLAAEELLWSQSRGVGGSLQRGWLERWPISKHFSYLLSLLCSQRLHMPYHIVMDYSLTVLFFLLFVAFPWWHLPASGEETQKLVLWLWMQNLLFYCHYHSIISISSVSHKIMLFQEIFLCNWSAEFFCLAIFFCFCDKYEYESLALSTSYNPALSVIGTIYN